MENQIYNYIFFQFATNFMRGAEPGQFNTAVKKADHQHILMTIFSTFQYHCSLMVSTVQLCYYYAAHYIIMHYSRLSRLITRTKPANSCFIFNLCTRLQSTLGLVSADMDSAIRNIWMQTDAVCFDVDSTVIQEEGIDELAKFCNKGEDVANLTRKAMSGKMTFQESLQLRLDIIQPSMTQIRDFIRTKPPTLTPGIKKLVEMLHNNHIPVYLISGGFRSIISPIASQLNIPVENIYANRLTFYHTGEYASFDQNSPTCRSGGKAVVIDTLKKIHGYNNLVLIGDGMTDLEACPPADAFIGYGGNVIREEVKSKAKWFVTDFNELVNVYEQ